VTERDYTEMASPVDGRELGRSPLDGAASAAEAMARARQAQPNWAGLGVAGRRRALRPVRDYLVDNADELAAAISADNGKTRVDALSTEVLPAAMALSYYLKKARSFLRPRWLTPGNLFMANKLSRLQRVPFGVVGIVSPWNYPFAIPFSEVVMALLAGNAVVLKVATQTQLVGRKLEEAFTSAGLPAGVFSYLNLPGSQAGEALLGEGGVDKLFFTGSVGVGKRLMAQAAETLTPVSLELGGNDAMLVCPDADLERAAAGAVWAGLSNCGQSCGGVERVYVHAAVYERFLDILKRRVEGLRIGPDTDHRVDLGAMTTTKQMAVVREHVDRALAAGARVWAQAPAPEGGGNFLPATVLVDVDHSMEVMREETFGPVLGVMPVYSMDEAVSLANDSHLGLTASVWSTRRRKAWALAGRLAAGAVTINDHLMSHGLAETPWGGFKQSGIGRTHGRLGFDEMTQPRVVVDDITPGLRRNIWWHPHGPEVYTGLKGILEALYGKGSEQRWQGLKRVVALLPRGFRP
jgi:succinate-semialdehyde dehydrogenase/glutarate-semialdehyde dehydrogenase